MSAPVYACARCGVEPRDGDTYLCVGCLDDPQRMVEMRCAQVGSPDNAKEQRRLLISMANWAGWHRRLKGGSGA